jgi:hypothetical protein
MIKSLLVLICIFSAPNLFALDLEASGRFQSTSDDSVAFVKQQLLASAYKDAMAKELKSMNLDHELFWANFDQKLSTYQEGIEKELATKMKLLDENNEMRSDLKRKEKDKFEKRLRLKKLRAQAGFGNLASIISRYSINKMSRSSKYPSNRYIRIKANVDRKQVHRLYLKYTSNIEGVRYEKLYISSTFQVKAMSWTDTGVEVESDFTDVVKKHWKEKLESILADQVETVVLANDQDIQKIKNAIKSKNSEESILWMNINVSLKKVSQSLESQVKTFSLHKEMTLQDVTSGKVITFADIESVPKEYASEDNERLSSNLAGAIYQSLLPKFRDIPSELLKAKPQGKYLTLVLDGQGNMTDLLDFNKKLAEVGVTKQFRSKIVGFTAGQALVRLDYSGAIDDTMVLLKKLDGVKLQAQKVVNIKDADKPTHFYISK